MHVPFFCIIMKRKHDTLICLFLPVSDFYSTTLTETYGREKKQNIKRSLCLFFVWPCRTILPNFVFQLFTTARKFEAEKFRFSLERAPTSSITMLVSHYYYYCTTVILPCYCRIIPFQPCSLLLAHTTINMCRVLWARLKETLPSCRANLRHRYTLLLIGFHRYDVSTYCLQDERSELYTATAVVPACEMISSNPNFKSSNFSRSVPKKWERFLARAGPCCGASR